MLRRRSKKRRSAYDPSAQPEITTRRDRATWMAILLGIGGSLAFYGVAALAFLYIASKSGYWWDSATPFILCVGSIPLVIAGGWSMWKARVIDDENYMMQKATPMPLTLANEHDDLWTEGRIRCPRPLRAPGRFGTRCAYYHFVHKQRRGSGKNARWVTISDYKRHTHAWLEQADLDIRLDLGKAEFQYLPSKTLNDGADSYTLTWLPAIGRASACGVVTISNFRLQPKRPDGRLVPPAGSPAARGEKPGTSVLDNPRLDGLSSEDTPFGALDTSLRASRARRRKEQRAERRRDRTRKSRLRPPVGSPAWQRANPGWESADTSELDETAQDLGDVDELIREVSLSADEREKQPDEEWKPSKPWLLTKMGNVPLMITPLARNEWYDRAEANEIHWGLGGTLGTWFGLSGMIWWLFVLGGTYAAEFAVLPLLVSLVLGFVVLLPALAVMLYNRFVSYRVRVRNAWAHIDADLRMRHDLIPALIDVIKAYNAHEAGLFEELAARRTAASALQQAKQTLDREVELTRMANRLVAVVEDHPDLKANTTFDRLRRELTAMEEKIAHGRSFYNEVVREFNTLIETFPNAVVAPALGFFAMPFWHDAA